MRYPLPLIVVASHLAGCAASPPIDAEPVVGDSLLKITSSDFDEVYIRPDTDFSRYSEIYVTDLQIEFERDWVSNQNLRDPYRITDRDIELIKKNLATDFQQSLKRGLAQSTQLRLVDTPSQDTLRLDPAILQLNINNPDNRQPYPTVTLAEISASMTIVLELVVPASGEVLARLSDRGRTRDYLNYSQQDVVKNQSDINKLFFDWAVALGNMLNSNEPDK